MAPTRRAPHVHSWIPRGARPDLHCTGKSSTPPSQPLPLVSRTTPRFSKHRRPFGPILTVSSMCCVLPSRLQTCRRLFVLGQESSVLARVGFAGDWPTDTTKALYQRAAREGNFEANMKLGVACLYGEGCSAAPGLASEMLMRAEQLAGPNDPFSWLLYRPPWSSDSCSKALIFKDMLALAEENQNVVTRRYSGIMYCVAKTLWCVPSRVPAVFSLEYSK